MDIFLNPTKIKYQNKTKEPLFLFKEFAIYVIITFLISTIGAIVFILFSMKKESLEINPTLLGTIIVAPFIEEILFRGILKINKGTICLFIYALTTLTLKKMNLIEVNFYNTLIVLVFVVFLIIILRTNQFEKEHLKYTRYKKIIVYISAFTFGFLHLRNFNSVNIFVFPILFYGCMQVLGGFMLNIIRLKYGLLTSVLFHLSLNGVIYLLVNLV